MVTRCSLLSGERPPALAGSGAGVGVGVGATVGAGAGVGAGLASGTGCGGALVPAERAGLAGISPGGAGRWAGYLDEFWKYLERRFG